MKLSYYQSEHSNISTAISSSLNQLTEYRTQLAQIYQSQTYESPESALNLPFDATINSQINTIIHQKVSSNLKYLVVIGIGGSILGAQAVYHALFGHTELLQPNRYPKLIPLDTTNPRYLTQLTTFINRTIISPEEILINVVSKSGNTTETIYNINWLIEQTRIPPERLIVTTAVNSPMHTTATELGITTLPINDYVGGRYSVFSPVGIFPLTALGVNMPELWEGAQAITTSCLNEDLENNSAALSAATTFAHYQQGRHIHVNFFFNPELETLGKWYQQLIAESLGKSDQVGITPYTAIGSTDLHSLVQLFLAGPDDKFTTFIKTITPTVDETFLKLETFNPSINLQGKTPSNIIDAIYSATQTAYLQSEKPYARIDLDHSLTYSLGEFMQFKMIETMYLAQLFGVDAFDQPAVESYKSVTRKLLNTEDD